MLVSSTTMWMWVHVSIFHNYVVGRGVGDSPCNKTADNEEFCKHWRETWEIFQVFSSELDMKNLPSNVQGKTKIFQAFSSELDMKNFPSNVQGKSKIFQAFSRELSTSRHFGGFCLGHNHGRILPQVHFLFFSPRFTIQMATFAVLFLPNFSIFFYIFCFLQHHGFPWEREVHAFVELPIIMWPLINYNFRV